MLNTDHENYEARPQTNQRNAHGVVRSVHAWRASGIRGVQDVGNEEIWVLKLMKLDLITKVLMFETSPWSGSF
jgi:hypothetical protein